MTHGCPILKTSSHLIDKLVESNDRCWISSSTILQCSILRGTGYWVLTLRGGDDDWNELFWSELHLVSARTSSIVHCTRMKRQVLPVGWYGYSIITLTTVHLPLAASVLLAMTTNQRLRYCRQYGNKEDFSQTTFRIFFRVVCYQSYILVANC